MERPRAILWAQLALRITPPDRRPPPRDRRCGVRLGVSSDWLYRNSGRLSFTARVPETALGSAERTLRRASYPAHLETGGRNERLGRLPFTAIQPLCVVPYSAQTSLDRTDLTA